MSWVEIDGDTDYLRVPGGAVIRSREFVDAGRGAALTMAMVFVPMDNVAFARWSGVVDKGE